MDEEELLEFLLGYLPESWEGWLAIALAVCAVLAIVLPRPDENCHPALRLSHRLICILGMGAGKLKNAGKIGKAFRRRS